MSFSSSTGSVELIIKIEGFAILLPLLTEIYLSQSDHTIILREYSLGFLEKEVSSQILYLHYYYYFFALLF